MNQELLLGFCLLTRAGIEPPLFAAPLCFVRTDLPWHLLAASFKSAIANLADDTLTVALRFIPAFIAPADVAADLAGCRRTALHEFVAATIGRAHGTVLLHDYTTPETGDVTADAPVLLDAVLILLYR